MPTSSAPTVSAPDGGAETVPALAWRVHLLRQRPDRLGRILSAALAVFALSLALFRSPWLALLPTAAVILSLSEFLFPAHYALSARSARSRFGLTDLEIRWRDVRHAYLTDEGIKLSPLRTRNARWEPLRGVFLRFGPDNRDEVIACVRRLRAESVSEPAPESASEAKTHG